MPHTALRPDCNGEGAPGRRSKKGALIGGIVGGVAGAVLIAALGATLRLARNWPHSLLHEPGRNRLAARMVQPIELGSRRPPGGKEPELHLIGCRLSARQAQCPAGHGGQDERSRQIALHFRRCACPFTCRQATRFPSLMSPRPESPALLPALLKAELSRGRPAVVALLAWRARRRRRRQRQLSVQGKGAAQEGGAGEGAHAQAASSLLGSKPGMHGAQRRTHPRPRRSHPRTRRELRPGPCTLCALGVL